MVSTSQKNNWTKNTILIATALLPIIIIKEKKFEEIHQKKSLELLGENNSVEIRKNKVHPG